MKPGDVFYHRNCTGIQHMMIVLADSPETNETFLVSISTFKPYKDSTCIIVQSDYPLVQHKSCVEYDRALTANRATVARQINLGHITVGLPPISQALLQRVTAGVFKSDRVKPDERTKLKRLLHYNEALS